MDIPARGSRPGDQDRRTNLLRWRWPLAVTLLVAAGLVFASLDIATDFPSKVTCEWWYVAPVLGEEFYHPVTGKLNVAPVPGGQRCFVLHSSVDDGVAWMVANWRGFFRAITGVLLQVLGPIEDLLLWLPWWLFMALVGLLAWRVRGYKFALCALAGLLFIGVVQMWDQAMRTLAVVGSATVMSVIVAVPVGIAMSKNERLNGLMLPILDTMQTMPSYVYLIPAIYFLGLGKVPAVVATMVYAVPPAMRLTNLGIRLVSTELKEAARAFGATPWQMLIKVELPLARPTIMAGINQTTMMALAMVVIASIVGAQGLGADVLAGIFNLEFGNGLVAGIGIVILAVIIDRITQGLAQERGADISST